MTDQTNQAYDQDVVVVGAGAAGMAAATVTATAGLKTLVLDENAHAGGQIWRAITAQGLPARAALGTDYSRGREIAQAFAASGAVHLAGATVWSLDREREIGISTGGTARMIRARRVIIATGAIERPFPVPGWTLPGVMTIGAAQTVLKASGLAPDGRVVLAGCGPLLWLYASQLLAAGGRIATILDTSENGLRRDVLQHAPAFARSPYLLKGLKLVLAVRRRVRVVTGVTELAIDGGARAESVVYRCGAKPAERMLADVVLLHQGVVPHVNLAMAAGIEHRWNSGQLCFTPVLDSFGTSAIDGIAIAGDGAGIAGAEAAVERGKLAGIAAARALAVPDAKLPDETAVRRTLARFEAPRAFLDALFRPADAMRLPDAATIVCRCEEVTAGDIAATLTIGPEGPNQMKSFLRCGMGPCQGRMCGLTVTELIARGRGVSPDVAGYFRLRPPVKPITLAEIASLPATPVEIKAVVRG